MKYYAIKNKNLKIRMSSSSGAFFDAISKKVISLGGVVYGAAYDKNNNIEHIRVTTLDEIQRLHGSKYSQSNLNDCYKNAINDIENDKYVLFSGTPCQIAVLNNMMKKKDITKLITLDVVCHGTPEKKYFVEYKKYLEKKFNSELISLNMRYKKNRNIKKRFIPTSKVAPHSFKAEFKNGKKLIESGEFNIYNQLFDYFLKKGCFKCPFSNLKRVSDLTIGDFHEFNTNLNEFNDGCGVSLVIINTNKGFEIFDSIKEKFEFIEKTQKEILQPALERPTTEPKDLVAFDKDYNKYGFDYIVKKYTNQKLKFKFRKLLDDIGVLNKLVIIKRKIR